MKYLIAFFLFVPLMLPAQNVEKDTLAFKVKPGIACSIQFEQFGILIPIHISEKAAVVPSFRLNTGEDLGMDISFGLGFRTYLNDKKVRPYVAPGIGVLVAILPEDDNMDDIPNPVDFIFGLGFGGEYYLDEHFSFGVEVGVNASISDEASSRFGNPGGTNVNTAAAAIINVYF